MLKMTETSAQIQTTLQKPCRPQIKTSYSFPSNNIFPESQNQFNQFPSPINNNYRSRSNTFSSIFSSSRSSIFFRNRRSEIYQENDEFTRGCFGLLCTLGSKIKYKINDSWLRFKRRLHKENN
jgi:hypothetical protein